MEDTTHRPGDRVRVFAPGQGHHGMTGTIERTTQLPTRDLWVRLERNGHVVLCLPGELRRPGLTMSITASALLAAWHATGDRGSQRDLRKLSDNVVGTERVRRYASSAGVQLELTTAVELGATRIGDGFRARRDACADCGAIDRAVCCCAANRAEAARRWAAISDPIPVVRLTNGVDEIIADQPATPEVLNDRMRALLTKAGAVIR